MRYIFNLGMYRSCSTWQYEVVSHLAETHLNAVRLGFIEGIHFTEIPTLEHAPERLRVLKTHDVHPIFVRELDAGTALPIYAFRDLRDVVFSFMHKAGLEFQEIIDQKFLPKVLANDAYWRSRPGLFLQRYEDVIADQGRAVHELANCLGLRLPASEVTRLAAEYSWESNLKRTREVKRKAEAAGLDLDDKAHIFEHDPHTLLHWNHLREGKRKTWRELATPEQRELLAVHCADWLIANSYESDTAWVNQPALKVDDHPKTIADTWRLDHAEGASGPSRWIRRLWPVAKFSSRR